MTNRVWILVLWGVEEGRISFGSTYRDLWQYSRSAESLPLKCKSKTLSNEPFCRSFGEITANQSRLMSIAQSHAIYSNFVFDLPTQHRISLVLQKHKPVQVRNFARKITRNAVWLSPENSKLVLYVVCSVLCCDSKRWQANGSTTIEDNQIVNLLPPLVGWLSCSAVAGTLRCASFRDVVL